MGVRLRKRDDGGREMMSEGMRAMAIAAARYGAIVLVDAKPRSARDEDDRPIFALASPPMLRQNGLPKRT